MSIQWEYLLLAIKIIILISLYKNCLKLQNVLIIDPNVQTSNVYVEINIQKNMFVL